MSLWRIITTIAKVMKPKPLNDGEQEWLDGYGRAQEDLRREDAGHEHDPCHYTPTNDTHSGSGGD